LPNPYEDFQDEDLHQQYEEIECGHHHHHEEECECGHHHHHEEECECEHHHHHEEECECGHHHHHEEECECGHHHHHDEECECGHHHHHHADEIFSSVGFETAKKYDMDALEKILDSMSKGAYGLVVRAKGVVSNLNGAWYEFNLTPEEVEVKPCCARPIGKICVIGSKIDEHQIKELF
ncbi:MAG: cobalamin biosynthesis protein CobW, partial [Anaeroplasmataceae bacterium]|nr:cobalamin biosynthesis protein CobW [Anaeroplasmataceae bacterium]